jgi:lincosamide nucleotidyltransferase A/C/D/E
MMTAESVVDLYKLAEANEIQVWIDGGWGVDALLRMQTRDHQDLDLAVDQSGVEKLIGLLKAKRYTVYQDELPTRIELRDDDEHRVDLHPLKFDAEGNGLQELQDGTFGTYTSQGLSGTGVIGGEKMRCLSPEIQMLFHSGYTPREHDHHDVLELHRKFGLDLPPGYSPSVEVG